MLSRCAEVAGPSWFSTGTRALLMAPLLLLFLPSVHSEPLFAPALSFEAGGAPFSVAIRDLDSDGRPDLAVANRASNTVSVHLGNGDGTFGTGTGFVTGSAPLFVAIADLNADGRPDLAVANENSNTVSVLLGNGDGTFRARSDFGTGYNPQSVAIADLNGDGRPDLAVVNMFSDTGPGTVSVLLGNEDGTFGAETRIGLTGYFGRSVAIGDLNADGRQDLAVSSLFGAMFTILPGNGDGTFGGEIGPGFGGAYGNSVVIADLNADGRPDLAVTSSLTDSGGDDQGDHPPACWFPCPRESRVVVFLGTGEGGFADGGAFPTTGTVSTSLAIADLDADRRPDLAVASGSSNTVAVLLGVGDGSFGAKTDFGIGGVANSMAIADLNGDGQPDLAVANPGSNTISVLLNRTAPIAMGLAFTPGTLNLASRSRWVTALLEPAAPYDAGTIDLASIRLNDTVPVDPAAPTILGDHDGNGVPDLMVRFSRAAVEPAVSVAEDVSMTVTGMVDGHPFLGADHLRVRWPLGPASAR